METTITVDSGPYALIWNSTNNKVYCANWYSANVTVIDGQNNTVITTIPVGDSPRAFCWNSIQNRTYVANFHSSSISVLRDVTGIEERQTHETKRFMVEVYPNPAKSIMHIRVPLSAKEIKIFDASGRLIKEIATTSSQSRNDGEAVISLKGINPGIYFLRLGKETKKLLVVK